MHTYHKMHSHTHTHPKLPPVRMWIYYVQTLYMITTSRFSHETSSIHQHMVAIQSDSDNTLRDTHQLPHDWVVQLKIFGQRLCTVIFISCIVHPLPNTSVKGRYCYWLLLVYWGESLVGTQGPGQPSHLLSPRALCWTNTSSSTVKVRHSYISFDQCTHT